MDNEKIYDKLCDMHSDISSIKTKQKSQDETIALNTKRSSDSKAFINKSKGGLIVITSSVIGLLVKVFYF